VERVASIILARQGSKRLKDKNIARLGDRTLLEWAIDAARDSNVINEIYVSTDSDVYGEIASIAGASVIWRPPELCTDDASSEDGVKHALTVINHEVIHPADIAVLSQPTSPLTKPETIRKAVAAVLGPYNAALSVVQAKHKLWWAYKDTETGGIEPFITLPKDSPFAAENPPPLYYPTGGVYAFKPDYFLTTGRLVGGLTYGVQVSPLEAIDIDDEFDLSYARWALKILDNVVQEKELSAV
jgi:CMP-N,N'-diacetyllegionaminic acid synthase